LPVCRENVTGPPQKPKWARVKAVASEKRNHFRRSSRRRSKDPETTSNHQHPTSNIQSNIEQRTLNKEHRMADKQSNDGGKGNCGFLGEVFN
jgi:hypothetical protein